MKDWLIKIIFFLKQVILPLKTMIFKKGLVRCIIYCLNKKISIIKAAKEQNEMLDIIEDLNS